MKHYKLLRSIFGFPKDPSNLNTPLPVHRDSPAPAKAR